MSGSPEIAVKIPTLKDKVRIETSKVHKGRIASEGCVFLIASLKYDGMIYSKCIPINRQQCNGETDAKIKEDFKDLFFEELKKQQNRKN